MPVQGDPSGSQHSHSTSDGGYPKPQDRPPQSRQAEQMEDGTHWPNLQGRDRQTGGFNPDTLAPGPAGQAGQVHLTSRGGCASTGP